MTGSITFTVNEKTESGDNDALWMQHMEEFKNDPRWATNGKSWGSDKKPELSKYNCKSCLAYVNDFVAYVYGLRNEKSDKVTRIDSTSQEKTKDMDIRNIRAGDIVAFSNPDSSHYFVVISIDWSTGKMYTMEGNANHKVRVGDNYYRVKDGKLQINWPKNKKNNWSTKNLKWIKHFDDYKS